jgi:phage virion morphogenesis protein
MTGAQVTIEVHSEPILKALNGMLAAAEDLTPLLDAIGFLLEESTRQRFTDQVDPEGRPWAPLSPAYRASKPKNQDLILVLNGYLVGSFRHQAGKDEVRVGTDVAYAAVHQFGASIPPHVIRARGAGALFWPGAAHPVKQVNFPGAEIPARPFLGVSADDERGILDLANEYLAQSAGV